MFVYLVPLKDRSAFKIGRARSPDDRLSTLSADYEFDLDSCRIVDCVDNKASIVFESFLHRICAPHQHRLEAVGGTEFFDYSCFEMVISAVENLARVAGYELRIYQAPAASALLSDVARVASRVAEILRFRRLEMNITQANLAEACGVSAGTIKRVESAESVSVACLYKVCLALGL